MAVNCKNWQAWLDTMPPRPPVIHVTGDVIVGNPGLVANLTKREPQGINPTALILDLHLVQQPGNWIQVVSCATAKFERTLARDGEGYSSIEIFSDNERIALIDHIPETT